MTKNKGYTRVNSFIGMAPLVLFLSSYLPLFLLIALRQTITNFAYLNWGGFNLESIYFFFKYFGMASICCFLAICGLLGTFYVFKNLDRKIENGYIYRIMEVSSLNDEPLAYVATYIIPILFEDYSDISDCITIGCIFYVIYRLYIRSKLILVNPLLNLKFSIYNIKFKDGEIYRQGILISKDNGILEGDIAKIYNIGYQLYYGYKKIEQ